VPSFAFHRGWATRFPCTHVTLARLGQRHSDSGHSVALQPCYHPLPPPPPPPTRVLCAAEEAERLRAAARRLEEQTKAARIAAHAAHLSDVAAQIAAAPYRTTADLEGRAPAAPAPRARRVLPGEPHPTLGVSSAQWFDGEDHGAKARAAAQAAQMAVWAEEAARAAAERRAREEEDKR
jgi:hypothetical protein